MEQNEFEILVRQIRPQVLHEAIRYTKNSADAEDIAQDVMLKLWCLRDKLSEYRSVEALAVVMAKHLSLNRLRSAFRMVSEEEGEEPSDSVTPEELFVDKEEDEQVKKLIATLPGIQQATLRMKHVDGIEIAEIALVIVCTENAVRANLSRARKKIMSYFIK